MKLRELLERHRWVSAFLVFVLAFAWRAIRWFRDPWYAATVEVRRATLCFAQNGFIGNPYVLPTGPTAHVTPAFPFLMGLVYRIAPNRVAGDHWVYATTTAMTALQFAALPFLARLMGFGTAAGVIAAVIGAAVSPLYLECSGDFEAPLIALALVLTAIGSFSLDRWRQRPQLALFLRGLMWGATALVSTQLLLGGLLYESVRVAASNLSIRRRVLALACMASGFVAATLPWTVRNYVLLGSPVISRDNAGLELYVSNNDGVQTTVEDNVWRGTFKQKHPNRSIREAQLVQQLGEIRYNKLKRAEAIDWITSHPKKFLELAAIRFKKFWTETIPGTVQHIYWEGILIFGLAGLWLCWRLRQANVLLFVILLAVFSLPHLAIQASYRYRYPLNPILLLFTGYLLTWFATHMRLFQKETAATSAAS